METETTEQRINRLALESNAAVIASAYIERGFNPLVDIARMAVDIAMLIRIEVKDRS